MLSSFLNFRQLLGLFCFQLTLILDIEVLNCILSGFISFCVWLTLFEEMNKRRKMFRDRSSLQGCLVLLLVSRSFGLCWSMNDEGKALLKLRQSVESDPFGALSNWVDDGLEFGPCSWFGVECSDGKVVVLNLKDLCLRGTLPPALASLVHIRSIILRNNFFFGIIPEAIGKLMELEFVDLGYNDFRGPLPVDFGCNPSLAILLLDNNYLLGGVSPEIYELTSVSKSQVDENLLSRPAKLQSCSRSRVAWGIEAGQRRLQQVELHGSPGNIETRPPPTDAPATNPPPTDPNDTRSPSFPPLEPPESPSPSASSIPNPNSRGPPRNHFRKSSTRHLAVLIGAIGGFLFIFAIIGIYLFKTNKVATVKPWATGLSGQLQKAFVTGVPKLKRSEIEAACEDFSNVICTSPIGTVYKGTLSSGVEIAVASITVTSARDWPKSSEAQFRKKIEELSKVNHKNFVNLLGYCQEEEPFTRMMVFEYASNGTLFEHLHIQESDHLDLPTRLRIAMGMAYCMQHMHQLNPPVTHSNLNSSAVYLTEDYGAKISELFFWNEITSVKTKAPGEKHVNAPSRSQERNVYSFGVILFEMMTGQLPYSVDDGSLEDWASNYVRGEQHLKEIVDPTLDSVREDQLQQIADLIKSCCQPDPLNIPTMEEICEILRKTTGITPKVAAPKLSPLWWAELEIMSADGD